MVNNLATWIETRATRSAVDDSVSRIQVVESCFCDVWWIHPFYKNDLRRRFDHPFSRPQEGELVSLPRPTDKPPDPSNFLPAKFTFTQKEVLGVYR